jgi:phosphatidylinositol glycan class B
MNPSHPDEYWQSIEPAYNMVYGGVHLPWEWDVNYKLRSTFYPALLAIPLYILKTLGLDTAFAVRICPLLTHIVLVIISDRYLWKIGKATVGKN